ncbi:MULTISPECIES: lycopene cyclase family protein [Flavobacterium]|uniref:Lycopene cyclase family protein n=1 Tax=Flavobacterium hankyongi TaxID=1176532 RepID=A0ABP9A4E3_9FLAO|nr:lycopene cyclase family protein [Flavobacterium sp. N1846]
MKYDFIFSGLGLAAMMTIIKMAEEGILENKNVLVIEPDDKNINDRTWCFWEEGKGKWDEILKHKWDKAFFINQSVKIDCLNGLSYKMIESKSFYNYYKEITKDYNIKWIKEKFVSFAEDKDSVIVETKETNYVGSYLFNSVFDYNELKNQEKFPLLQQHFVGWFIRSEKKCFNPAEALFMDFSVPQRGNTRFMYVLPVSEKEALIEYTLFSSEVLGSDEYESEIKTYLENFGIETFEIISKEKGNIPMTAYPFWKNNTKKILNIGTVGGWTKASSGFTFSNTDRESKKVVEFFNEKSIDFREFKKSNRFTFYDDLFVDVLYRKNFLGKQIFSSMFTTSNPNLILKFLDEKTSILEDFRVILSCPKKEFIKSFFRRIFK